MFDYGTLSFRREVKCVIPMYRCMEIFESKIYTNKPTAELAQEEAAA
jgi:hypothetical protein